MNKRLRVFVCALTVALVAFPEAIAMHNGWNPDNLGPFPFAVQELVCWLGVVGGFGVALGVVIDRAVRRILRV